MSLFSFFVLPATHRRRLPFLHNLGNDDRPSWQPSWIGISF